MKYEGKMKKYEGNVEEYVGLDMVLEDLENSLEGGRALRGRG